MTDRSQRTAKRLRGITEKEVEEVEELSTPRTPVIYEIVRRLGEEEMARPFASLWWSGTAAGLSISFSLLAQALLENALPPAAWRPLISSFGYSVGFLMAVLSRQQLFTESTITAVLPLAANFTFGNFARVARMWSIVLIANLVGTLVAAALCSLTPVLAPKVLQVMIEISRHLLELWLIPNAEGAQFHVITMVTYLIALGGFTHIVAGSVETFILMINGDAGIGWVLLTFGIPTLFGNIIGGTALFAVIAYAQVMKEI
jgi:formate/nitrite transporter FocA (FNT family)